ncbi:MAG: hypothetical protein LQ351_007112 [Letrouitia transgressa]|nr:MAG: hypothetical protein LQ351_007112 [Letrouitia transgressa]
MCRGISTSDGLNVKAHEPDSWKSRPLLQPLQDLTSRCSFLKSVYNLNLGLKEVQQTDGGFESYFARYSNLCNLAVLRNRQIEVLTHGQLLEAISQLRSPAWPRETTHIIAALVIKESQTDVDRGFAETLIDLAASVWSSIAIGKFPGDISNDEPVEWRQGALFTRLSDPEFSGSLVGKLFSGHYATNEVVKLPQSFTAAYLEQVGGIQIRWTNNLADHLLLKDDDTKLMLFHQVSALRLHKASPDSLFPPALVDETLRTISLLIPPVLGACNPWFQAEQQKQQVDENAGLCDRLNSSERQIDRFVFWRERLVLLKRTFDEAEPRTLSQLWWDDRRKSQWFTFWVAVLVFIVTVFFGVIQSVASIVQAWASVKSLKANGINSVA